MKSLLEDSGYQDILGRINQLHPDSPAVWGKMNVAQMFAHCSAALEYACGDYPGKQALIGKIIGSFLKKNFVNDVPFHKSSPTAPKFVIADQREFNQEKNKLISNTERFYKGGPSKVTRYPHLFFGKLTPEQWGIGMYKHMDHHLRQFGV